MTDPPLKAEHFGRRYRRDRPWAVRDVSFALPEGSIAALVGPNGAGKSTLIRACMAFEVPDAGRVLVFGADPQRHRSQALDAIGYVPQSFALYRGLSIGDHLTMAAAARRSFDVSFAARRVEHAGLDQRRKVGELSGGEQAQIALALALGTRAPLLLLDEPLASLDPLARRDFMTTMAMDVRQRGATAMISSHLVGDIDQVCDWLVVLARGQLALVTSVTDAKSRFTIVADPGCTDQKVIGSFPDPTGSAMVLIDDGGGRPATLEEIVLGHLAAARPSMTALAR